MEVMHMLQWIRRKRLLIRFEVNKKVGIGILFANQ